MAQLVRVKIIAEPSKHTTIVDYIGVKYLVNSVNLQNYIIQYTPEGAINYAYINQAHLKRRWS